MCFQPCTKTSKVAYQSQFSRQLVTDRRRRTTSLQVSTQIRNGYNCLVRYEFCNEILVAANSIDCHFYCGVYAEYNETMLNP